jgi:hypothetical protein
MIPTEDRLLAALAAVPTLRARREAPWPIQRELADVSAYRAAAIANMISNNVRPDAVRSTALQWGTVDWVGDQHRLRGGGVVRVTADGPVDGLVVWFATTLLPAARDAPEIGFDTAPGDNDPAYARGVLLFDQALDLREGDEVEVRVRTDRVRGSDFVTWSVTAPGGSAEGSTFNALPLSGAAVRRASQQPGG